MTPFTVTAGAFKAFRSETQPGVCVGREGGRRLGICVRIMTIQQVCEYSILENITQF